MFPFEEQLPVLIIRNIGRPKTKIGLSSYTNWSSTGPNKSSTSNLDGLDQYRLGKSEFFLERGKKLKRTVINIDSINRVKQPVISTKILGRLNKNPFITQFESGDIKVWSPYEALFSKDGRNTGKLKYPQFQKSLLLLFFYH